jgi:hypothetical protein
LSERGADRGEKPEQKDELGVLSEWGADDFDVAGTVWGRHYPEGARTVSGAMAATPQWVSADDLAQELHIGSGASVAGLLSWPTRLAVRADRPAPIRAHDGTPTAYWMDHDVVGMTSVLATARVSSTRTSLEVIVVQCPYAVT